MLHKSLEGISCGMEWIRKGSVPLIENVQRAVDFYSPRLFKLFNVASKQQLYNALSDRYKDPDGARTVRANKLTSFQHNKTPIELLKELYPYPHSLFMTPEKHWTNNVNRKNRIFAHYEKVGDVKRIEPAHLNDLVDILLDLLAYKRPEKIFSKMKKPPMTTVHGYILLEKKRLAQLYQINRVFQDLQSAQLPISIKEQNQYLYMNFFRDPSEIQVRIDQAFGAMGKQRMPDERPKFSKAIFKRLNRRDPDTLNTLLQISEMNGATEVFEDLLRHMTYGNANRDTYKILCNCFSSGVFKDEKRFYDLVTQIHSHDHLAKDITLINELISGLIKFNDIKLAERVLEQLLTDIKEFRFEEEDVYKGVSIDHKNKYNEYLFYYDQLSKHVQMSPIKLIPNIDTFTPFLFYYSHHNQFTNVMGIINHIESMNLPMTTKGFRICFDSLSPQENIVLLDKLLTHFRTVYDFDHDILNTANKDHKSDPSVGQLLKLPDNMIKNIVANFNDAEITAQFEQYKADIKAIRALGSYYDLYQINHITYLKYEFLQQIHHVFTQHNSMPHQN